MLTSEEPPKGVSIDSTGTIHIYGTRGVTITQEDVDRLRSEQKKELK